MAKQIIYIKSSVLMVEKEIKKRKFKVNKAKIIQNYTNLLYSCRLVRWSLVVTRSKVAVISSVAVRERPSEQRLPLLSAVPDREVLLKGPSYKDGSS